MSLANSTAALALSARKVAILTFEFREAPPVIRREAGALPRIPLGLAHPAPQRLRSTARLRRDRLHGCPRGRMLRGVLVDHADGPFPHLR
jgi:hypothetical protein